MRHFLLRLPTNKLKILTLLAFGILLSACVTGNTPEPQPYLREQGDFFMQAGITSFQQHNYALASDQFTQAQGFYRRYDDVTGQAHALLNLSQVAFATGHYQNAQTTLGQAALLIQRHQLTTLAVHRDVLLSQLYLANGDVVAAEKILSSYDAHWQQPVLNADLRVLLIHRVKLEQLYQHDLSVWLNLLSQHSDPKSAAQNARLNRFRAWQFARSADTANSHALFEDVIGFYRNQADPAGLMASQQEWGEACVVLHDKQQAMLHFEKALFLSMANQHLANGKRALTSLRAIHEPTEQPEKWLQLEDWIKQLDASEK